MSDKKTNAPVIPWRYLVPRRKYFWLLRAARAVPEIRPHIDREARIKLAEAVLTVPALILALLAVPLIAVGGIGFIMTQLVPRADLGESRDRNSAAANSLVSPEEVRRRMGEA